MLIVCIVLCDNVYDYALSCECVMRCDVMSMNDDVDVHYVTMGIITHNFKEILRKEV